MQLLVLGPLEIAAGGGCSGLASTRRRTLLGVLVAARGQVVPNDRLVVALWGEQAPEAARRTLRSHISHLRRHLDELEPGGGELIVTRGLGYQLELTGHELDAARFEDEAARGSGCLHDDPSSALTLLDEALARWRGPAFDDLAEHEALRTEARRLEQMRVTACLDRAEALLALGRPQDAEGQLRSLVATEPLDERLHALLVLAEYRAGRQAEALATYRELQQRLRDELGVDPSPRLQRLHEQLLRQDPDIEGPAGPPAETGDAQRPGPAASTPLRAATPAGELVGRDEDVRAVASLVDGERLVTLTGPGGVGKSRLADTVAADVAERFPDGVARCALSPVRDGADVGPAVLHVLGLEQHEASSTDTAVAAALEGRRLLLVLDNCEHVLEALAPIIDAVLSRCPAVTMLATSREPLRLPGEHVWQVAPLPVPHGRSAATVGSAPAGALFVRRARAADPTFALTDANAATVAELCRRLDGLPLALELAAARMRAMEPADLLDRLDRRFALLAGGPRREQGRHRTLREVVEWSYQLLTDVEAELFARLSAFAGAFTLTTAEQVCAGSGLARDEIAGLLAELVDRSLVVTERAGERSRYRLLDTLRAFAGERLEASGRAEEVRRTHANHHVALVEDLGPRTCGAGERDAVTALGATTEDLRLAHRWLVAACDVSGALRLPAALHEYLLLRPHGEVFAWAEQAISLPGASDHSAFPAGLTTAALGAVNRGETGLARARAQQVLDAVERPSLVALRATAVLSMAALYDGRLDDVLRHAEQTASLLGKVEEPSYRALALLDPTLALLYRGDHEAARTHADEFARRAEEVDSPTALAWARYVQGETRLDDDPAAAAQRLEVAIEVARDIDGHLPLGAALVSLASLRARRGDPRRALPLFRDAVDHWRRLGDHTHQLTTLRNLVEVLVHLGEHEAAAWLHGAVTTASPPTFGTEATRLEQVGRRLADRLGADRTTTLAGRGRAASRAEMADEALAILETLLAT